MNTVKTSICSLVSAVAIALSPAAYPDDTDIYLNPAVPTGAEPLVMFVLDYRPNLASKVSCGEECNELVADGYLTLDENHQVTFFDLLRAVMKKVLDPLSGVKIGFMLNHADTCSGGTTSGPSQNDCSNGAYVLSGFNPMSAGADDPNKRALYEKLEAIPLPEGELAHKFQGKELYFELFRYLTGQGIHNGHVGYEDFGSDNETNLDIDFPLIAWDTAIEDGEDYISPLTSTSACARIFVINLMFQVSQQEDDSDDAVTDTIANGGMAGINLSGNNNNFDTVIRYLRDVDLADGSFGTVPDLDGNQSVISYFIVDPTKINQTTNGYANAGGTGTALALSDNPEELINTLNNIFESILSVSTTFVAPSVPVNVFNRAQTVNEVFLALFEADENGAPVWPGNLKKLIIAENASTGELELQDVDGTQAIDIDGRIKREALTFWTDGANLPTPDEDEVAGADGRSITRGGAGQQIPGFVNGNPGQSNSEPVARQLFTEDPANATTTGLIPLNADAATAAALWSEITQNWDPAPSATNYASAKPEEQQKALNILGYARGLHDDGTTRDWLMGDPLHSRPRPINYGGRADNFDEANPDIRILIGSNDGYLRMIQNTGPSTTAGTLGPQHGGENWAFIPREVIPLLDRLRSNTLSNSPVHPIGMDGSPVTFTEEHVVDGNLIATDGDKAYAFFGLRRGGKSLYALDVSEPDQPALLWKITKGDPGFSELGQTWSVPHVGKVQVGADVMPVLVFGGGYNGDDNGDDLDDLGKDAKNRDTRQGVTPAVGTDDDEGNALFIVNAETGALVWKFTKDSAGVDVNTKTRFHPDLNDSIPADVAAADTDGNGRLDRVYFGDTGGVVWRVDLAGLYDDDNDPNTPEIIVENKPEVWSITKLFTAGRHFVGSGTADRRFFNRPDVVQTRDEQGPYDAVIIGSGDREDPNGALITNWLYMIKDRKITSGDPPTTTLGHDDLADLTSNCLQSGTLSSCGIETSLFVNGWRIQLETPGEKNLAGAITVGGSIFFTTFIPAATASTCSLNEGEGRLYALGLQDGTAVMNFDTTNDDTGTTYERSDKLASGGIPVEVIPIGQGKLLAQGQEAGANIIPAGGRTSFRTYWYELPR